MGVADATRGAGVRERRPVDVAVGVLIDFQGRFLLPILDSRDATLHTAHAVQIFVQLVLIHLRQRPTQILCSTQHQIQHAVQLRRALDVGSELVVIVIILAQAVDCAFRHRHRRDVVRAIGKPLTRAKVGLVLQLTDVNA